MNIVLEKQKIKQLIDAIQDEAVIGSIKKYIGIISDTKKQTIDKDGLRVRALESEEAINEGRAISIEDLEQEMKLW